MKKQSRLLARLLTLIAAILVALPRDRARFGRTQNYQLAALPIGRDKALRSHTHISSFIYLLIVEYHRVVS